MTVTIEPLGGLGNQLFVYALGLRLARALDVELDVDTWRFHKYPWHVYELDTFSNSISKTYSSRSREVFGHSVRRAIRGAQTLRVLPKRVGRLVIERGTAFDHSLLQVGAHSRLSGYFQSWRYFEPVADDLRAQINSVVSPSKWMQESREHLGELGNWTAVHARRGNYTMIPGMGIVGIDYYRRAVKEINARVGETPIVVFSDSPELLPEFEDLAPGNTIFIKPPQDVRAIEVLQVMSYASNLIIGNSTFSWWAGYLRDRNGRTVVAPRPWLDNTNFDARDLLPLSWITLGR
jgi:hypothetical protein